MDCDPVPASETIVVDASMPTQQGRARSGQGGLCKTLHACMEVQPL